MHYLRPLPALLIQSLHFRMRPRSVESTLTHERHRSGGLDANVSLGETEYCFLRLKMNAFINEGNLGESNGLGDAPIYSLKLLSLFQFGTIHSIVLMPDFLIAQHPFILLTVMD